MPINKIGIVGNGFVGNAVYENFKPFYDVFVYDSVKEKSFNSLEEVLKCDLVFVCLPTPMINAEGGKCNLSIINNFFANIPQNCSAIFAIKSTVPVGTTSKLRNSRKDLKIIHNPEFLTAMNSVSDFKNSERNIFGGDVQNCLLVQEALKIVTPKAVNIIVSSEESESIKYFSNTFLATKVAYFNLVYDLCLKFGINYDNVAYGICSDSRIGFSHSRVPGPDLDRGFGGSCFPKDINSLIDIFKENELDSTILEQIWTYNKKIRNNWDWKKNKSAVLEE